MNHNVNFYKRYMWIKLLNSYSTSGRVLSELPLYYMNDKLCKADPICWKISDICKSYERCGMCCFAETGRCMFNLRVTNLMFELNIRKYI